MDHSLARPNVAPHWRTATFVASAFAAAELLLLSILGLPMLGRAVTDEVRAAAEEHVLTAPAKKNKQARPAQNAAAKAAPALPRARTAVIVLNGNGRSGAAAAASARVRQLRYRVASVGNAPRSDYGRTIVMYRKGRRAEAERLAKDVGAKIVAPLDGLRARQLQGAHLALILGER